MNYPVASRKRRIVALLIDSSFYGYLASLFMYLVFFVFKAPWDTPVIHNGVGFISVMWLLGFIIFSAKDSFNGLGLGKLIMGIRVYGEDRKPASIFSSLIRNLPLLAWPIEALVMIISSSKKRIGDHLVETQVCRDQSITASNRWLALIFIVGFYWLSPNLPDIKFSKQGFSALSQMVVKQSHAFERAEESIRTEAAITTLVGDIQAINVRDSSSINIHNDQGDAEFVLDVVGKQGKIAVVVVLARKKSQWQVVQMHFEKVQSLPL